MTLDIRYPRSWSEMTPRQLLQVAGVLEHASGPRDEILEVYRKGGWEALEKRFNDKTGLRRHSSFIKSLIPSGVKRAIKSRK